MIRNFRHRGLRRLFERDDARQVPAAVSDRLRRVLTLLNRAQAPEDLDILVGMHPLKGGRKGEWAVTITRNWRVTFRFEDGDVADVNFEDYH